jgi:DNA-binding phage protein
MAKPGPRKKERDVALHPLVKELLEYIERKGISDFAAGDRAGYSHGTLYHWRNGHSPLLPIFCDVAEALGFKLIMVRK